MRSLENKNNFKNLQIGDNDLVGNKFNGHDLHNYLRQKGVDSSHLVWAKQSKDLNTYLISGQRADRLETYKYTEKLRKEYALDNSLGPLTYDLLYNKLYLEADVVHLHLIHNLNFDLTLLPIFSSLKPIVWTLHDPWALSGHCAQHYDCMKWKSGCGDCPYLDILFPINKDNTALNYEIKRRSITESKLNIIVASKFIEKKVKISPMFENAKIHHIPFGIDQNIFKPLDKGSIRKALNIKEDAIVITFRNEQIKYKGLDYIEYSLGRIKSDRPIYILTLSRQNWKCPGNHKLIEFGWVNDDKKLAEIFNATDLFLMPSLQETFGMMAIEAMSCGVLPIVLEGTALPEVTNSKECGVAVKPDKVEFTRVVQNYIDHDQLREDRARRCFEFASKEYNQDVYVERIIEVYKTAIMEHRLSSRYRYILEQLKKYMSIDPVTEAAEDSNANVRRPTIKQKFRTLGGKVFRKLPFNEEIRKILRF